MTYTDTEAQAVPRVVPSKWPAARIWETDPVESVRILDDVPDPAAAHVLAGREQVVRFATASQTALTQLRAWLRADRNGQYERTLSDMIYDLEGILEAYEPPGGRP